MQLSEAAVSTEKAGSYMKQLCRHWGHRFPVEFDDAHGRIEMPAMLCLLDATADSLAVRLELDEGADQDRMEEVVREHIQRFAFREQLAFQWKRSTPEILTPSR